MNQPSFRFLLLGLGVALAATGCADKSGGPAAAQAGARPPAPVEVLVVQQQPVTLTRELPGRTSASRVAEVRARINGIVLKRHFTEGADVSAGQLLFEIDPAPYQATLDSARATLARAEAALESSRLQNERYTGLVETHAVSQQAFDDAEAAFLAAQAEVAAAKAAVRSAEINLDYTRVTSPINGRIGRADVTEGAYVQQATATLLATVQQLDPLYVDLNQSAEQVLQLRDALASGELKRNADGAASFSVKSYAGNTHPQTGSLQFSDVSVNPGTGTVILRGLLPNPGLDLLPGMFVRATLEEGTQPDAILVPQSAVSRNDRGQATLYVVSPESTVELRIIETRQAIGDQWLVTSGLQPGDQVILNNLQKIRPGAPVSATPAAAQS
ncbi:efflux RND transporter periplasmic adaptor subunit [Actomonas aquatica]|uniref:Efflux RND transporter periplasmic adaptor subunit n=1 Tax=Actomonas aquatica TaxID=2866162 RepID=A0ABZ1C6D0_9BACT|nr:efflux RND transporter periplasmic adaptor subunit [Opitutus sp. WL0086]WRQ87284.1 efflux RND transporter periplasmic adaptor subunit [Opitutus sp. WL0086]